MSSVVQLEVEKVSELVTAVNMHLLMESHSKKTSAKEVGESRVRVFLIC